MSMNVRVAGEIYAFGNKAQKGARAGVLEQHASKIAEVAGHLRELGHAVTGVQHSTKSPAGYAKSTILHKSGKHKFKTTVRTSFNSEGGDHNQQVTQAPDVDERDDAVAGDDGDGEEGDGHE